MSWQYMIVQFKDQICNNFVRGTTQSRHMPTARIECSVAYPSYIWWAFITGHTVTYTRCGKDPTDIPKKSKDPPTTRVRKRKIKMSSNTYHELQGSTIFGDDITESTVWQWSSRSLFPQLTRRYYKTLSPSCMIGLSNELRTATNPEYMSYMCGHGSENKQKE